MERLNFSFLHFTSLEKGERRRDQIFYERFSITVQYPAAFDLAETRSRLRGFTASTV